MTERKKFIDVLRVVGAFFVIVTHVSGQGFLKYEINSLNWISAEFWNSISRFAVPIFFMISGSLFLNNKREVSIKKIYSKSISKLLVIFIIWSIVYNGLKIILEPNINFSVLIHDLINGPIHFWFIFIMVGLYVVTPLLREICKSKQMTEYFLVLSFIFTILYETIFVFFKSENLINYIDKFQILMPVGYVFYYILGFYVDEYFGKKINKSYLLFLIVLCTILNVLGTYYISISTGIPSEIFFGNKFLTTMIISTSIFYIFKNSEFNSNFFNNVFIIKLLNTNKFSLVIYTTHIIFVQIFNKLGIFFLIPQIIGIPIFSLLIYVLCCLIGLFILKLPKFFQILI